MHHYTYIWAWLKGGLVVDVFLTVRIQPQHLSCSCVWLIECKGESASPACDCHCCRTYSRNQWATLLWMVQCLHSIQDCKMVSYYSNGDVVLFLIDFNLSFKSLKPYTVGFISNYPQVPVCVIKAKPLQQVWKYKDVLITAVQELSTSDQSLYYMNSNHP